MQGQKHEFRMVFWLPVLWVTFYGCLLLVAVVFAFETSRVNLEALLFALVISPLAGLIVGLMMVPFLKVHVYDDGLRGHNCLGVPCWVPWDSISAASGFNLGGLKYLRVRSKTAGVIWLPLFHARQSELESLIRTNAPPENPLRQRLESVGMK
jgi:hypothetical protein